jgi:hypothetical protein
MNKRVFCIATVYLIFLFSGSLRLAAQVRFAVGEKTLSLGGAFTWNLAEFRAGITEVSSVRPNPVLILSSSASIASVPGFQRNSQRNFQLGFPETLDFSLSFDEGNAARFSDSAGHYRLVVPPSLETVDRRLARAGAGAALFPGGEPIVIEPHGKNALFAPGSHIRDFTIEFWLYPLNMENGEEILTWTASRPLRNGAASNGVASGSTSNGVTGYAYQRIECMASKNRLQWNFIDFFASPDGQKHLDLAVTGYSPVTPKSWSHHLIRFDADMGMLEYAVNGKVEAIVYASAAGHEGGEVYTPIAGNGGSFALGGRFMGMIDEFRIHGSCVTRPSVQRYDPRGGRMETRAIDLGQGGSKVLSVSALGGRTQTGNAKNRNGAANAKGASSGTVPVSEFKQNGRFRFGDDTEMQFFIRAANNPYDWDESAWRSFIPGSDIGGTVSGRYVQLAVDFYPSEDGESSPYLEELRITYQPDEPPLPPQNLAAEAVDGGVRLRWRNSPDTDTAGYLVYYGTVRGEYFGEDAAAGTSPIDVGKQNSVLIDGLKNGTLYYFTVAAYDRRDALTSFHAGEFSREVTARPLASGLPGLSVQLTEASR